MDVYNKLSDCFIFRNRRHVPYYVPISTVTVPCIKCGTLTSYKCKKDKKINYDVRCEYCRGVIK